MVSKVVVQTIKVILVFSVVVFLVVPLRRPGHFLLLIGSPLLFLTCGFLLKKSKGENTGDKFTAFLMKNFFCRNSGDQAGKPPH